MHVTKQTPPGITVQATEGPFGIGKTMCASMMILNLVFTSVPGVSLCSHCKAPGGVAEVGDGWGRRGRHHKPCPMLSMLCMLCVLCVLSCLKGS
jgi:hypothetical protein